MTDPLVLSVAEAAEALQVSDDLVYELTERGELPCLRFGRRKVIPPSAIDLLVELAVKDFDPAAALVSLTGTASSATRHRPGNAERNGTASEGTRPLVPSGDISGPVTGGGRVPDLHRPARQAGARPIAGRQESGAEGNSGGPEAVGTIEAHVVGPERAITAWRRPAREAEESQAQEMSAPTVAQDRDVIVPLCLFEDGEYSSN